MIKTGPNEETNEDPMTVLQKELSAYRYVKLPEVPTFTGGAVGYVAYDSIQHFEPKTKCDLKDNIGIPEAVFMIADTLIVYDHLFQNIKVVSHVFAPSNSPQINLAFIYQTAVEKTGDLHAYYCRPLQQCQNLSNLRSFADNKQCRTLARKATKVSLPH